MALDFIRRGKKVPEPLMPRVNRLYESQVLERIGRGRGTKYILSKSLYEAIGDRASYTKRMGLDKETNKQLLLKHLENFRETGSNMAEFRLLLPDLKRNQIKSLLKELKKEGRAFVIGKTRGARWFPKS